MHIAYLEIRFLLSELRETIARWWRTRHDRRRLYRYSYAVELHMKSRRSQGDR